MSNRERGRGGGGIFASRKRRMAPMPPTSMSMSMASATLYAYNSSECDEEGTMQYVGTQVEDSVTSTCFVIARPSTIPSDGAEHKVNVTVIDLEPRFEHETVPSKTPVAFLTAKIINTSTFPLLSGPTSIYLNNSFVAKGSVKAVSPKEEFDCSLGADPAVRITYKPASKFHERSGLISKTSTDTHEQHIEIKNTKVGETIKIIVREQIPKSTEEKIKIALLHPELPKKDDKKSADSPVKLDKHNNLEWTVHIAANETRELIIKYKIEHPAHEKIEFRQI